MKMITYIGHQEDVNVAHLGQSIRYTQGKPVPTVDDLADSLCRQPEKFRLSTQMEVDQAKFEADQAEQQLQELRDKQAAAKAPKPEAQPEASPAGE